MKKIFFSVVLFFLASIQSYEPISKGKHIIVTTMPIDEMRFLQKNPCFLIPSKTSIEAEYYYWENGRWVTLLVSKDLIIEKKANEQKFNVCGPYENKNIMNDYFFNNLLRYPHFFKPKKTENEDLLDIKEFINQYQILILSTLPSAHEDK